MKVQPKHFSDTDGNIPDHYDHNTPDSDSGGYHARHVKTEPDSSRDPDSTGTPRQAHPSGIPVPDVGSSAEYVPVPGDNRTVIAPNGAIIRNPWSEQPEIEPDHEYTEEKEDLNLIQL